MIDVLQGDVIEVLKDVEDGSYVAVFCDPPYGLSFMGKDWDHGVPGKAYWREINRVLKPGAVLLAFGGTRTFHRLACAIEDAGFEVFDCMMHLYGQGFPKSHSIEKAIDRAAGMEREVVGSYHVSGNALTPTKDKGGTYGVGVPNSPPGNIDITIPATPLAKIWQGYGTSLKPSFEPILVATKPLTIVPSDDILAEMNILLGGTIWALLSTVNSVDEILRLSPVGPGEASVFVVVLAALLHGAKSGELSEKMAMSSSPEMVSICLNIARLWSGILAEAWNGGNMFTTKMESVLIIGLRILRSLLLTNMPANLIQVACQASGQRLNVSTVKSSLPSEQTRLKGQKPITVQELAIWKQDANGIDAKNVVSALTPIIPSVVSVLDSVLVAIQADKEGEESLLSVKNVGTSSEIAKAIVGVSSVQGVATSSTFVPNWEPIILARKPRDGTYAQCAVKHGTGALAIDACRIRTLDKLQKLKGSFSFSGSGGANEKGKQIEYVAPGLGRWPSNCVLSHNVDCQRRGVRRVTSHNPDNKRKTDKSSQGIYSSYADEIPHIGYADADGMEEVADFECTEECAIRLLGEQSGQTRSNGGGGRSWGASEGTHKGWRRPAHESYNPKDAGTYAADSGTAARFFQNFESEATRFRYQAKEARVPREAGLKGHFPCLVCGEIDSDYHRGKKGKQVPCRRCGHPTVKPLALCKYLATLIRPPEEYLDDAKLLVPFSGVSSEMLGAMLAGWKNVTGIEKEEAYCDIARVRIKWWQDAMESTQLTEPKEILAVIKNRKPTPLFEEGK